MHLGPFTLDKSLGSGGMGDVWRAHHPNGLAVAIKVLRLPLPMGENDLARVQTELQALAALPHPQIVQLLDHGVVSASAAAQTTGELEAGQVWMAMEHCDGKDLAVQRPVSWDEFEPLIRDALSALAFAHARGVLHRDIKPDNLIRHENGLKLADLGLAFSVNHQQEVMAAGTPQFMAPEQLTANWRAFGPWTDLYALGTAVWRLICGRDVYHSSKSLKALAKAKLNNLLPMFEPQMAVPHGCNAWLNRNLQRQPEHRFQRAADALLALDQLGPGWMPVVERIEYSSVQGSSGDTMVSHASTHEQDTLAAPPPIPMTDDVVVADRTQPSPPADWRSLNAQASSLVLREAGLALFNLRDIPYTGRQTERDIVWRLVCQTHEQRSARAALLVGPAGTGKSRLARWLLSCAHQSGAIEALETQHSEHGGAAEGLRGFLVRHFRTAELEGAKLLNFLRRRLIALGATRDYAWRSLAAVIQPDVEGDETLVFADRLERFAAVSDYLALLAQRRPVMLLIEDAQWAAETVVFAVHLLRRARREGWPVMVVSTLRDDLLPDRPLEARAIAALEIEEWVETVDVPPMTPEVYSDFIDHLLPFRGETKAQLLRASRGRPLYAVSLVGEWVRQSALALDHEGFWLKEEHRQTMPESLHQLWLDRLKSLEKSLGAHALRALELMAVMGGEMDHLSWASLCQKAELKADADLILELANRGLADHDRESWRLCHGLFAQSVLRAAESLDRRTGLHRLAADWIADYYEPNQPGRASSLAHHRVAAAQPQEALQHFVSATRESFDAGDLLAAKELIDTWQSTAQECGLDPTSEAMSEGMILRCRILAGLGETDRAIALAKTQVARAEALGWHASMGGWHRALGAALVTAGDPNSALKHLQHAVDEDQENRPVSRRRLAEALWRCGRFRDAIEQCRTAQNEAQTEARNSAEYGLLECTLARALSAAGHNQDAADLLRHLVERAEARGWRMISADARLDLAEVLRREDRLKEAKEMLEEARQAYASMHHKNLVFAEANLAVVAVTSGDLSTAERALGRIDSMTSSTGDRGLRGAVAVLRVALEAQRGDWTRVDEQLQIAQRLLKDTGYADQDLQACYALALAQPNAPEAVRDQLQHALDEQNHLLGN